MKPAWSLVKLRCLDPVVPDPGTVLYMPTGRRYQIIKVRGKTMHCLVVPAGKVVQGPVLAWFWAPRARRSRLAALA